MKFFPSWWRTAALLCFLGFRTLGLASAQEPQGPELQSQSSPFSVYLDLRPAPSGAPAQTVPGWIEGFEFLEKDAKSPGPAPTPTAGSVNAAGSPVIASVFRIRVQRPSRVSDDLQVRVFFDDRLAGKRPCVTAWDELGTELMRSSPLGQGLGLAASETLTIPMTGVNYLEIETGGDGSEVRGVFFSWLEKAQIRQPIDFPTAGKVTEPFRVISATRARNGDSFLYGVVTAALLREPVTLSAASATAAIQFELERQPLVAVVSFEVLGATLGEAPLVRMNGRSLGSAEMLLPDLADPGYQGHSREDDPALGFHYTGWVRAQKVVPGQLLLGGLNELRVELSNGSAPFAVRAVAIQLKYNWEKLDYVLAPVIPVPTP